MNSLYQCKIGNHSSKIVCIKHPMSFLFAKLPTELIREIVSYSDEVYWCKRFNKLICKLPKHETVKTLLSEQLQQYRIHHTNLYTRSLGRFCIIYMKLKTKLFYYRKIVYISVPLVIYEFHMNGRIYINRLYINKREIECIDKYGKKIHLVGMC